MCGDLEKQRINNSGSCSLLPERTYNMMSCRAGPVLTLGLYHRSALLKMPGWRWSSAPADGGSKRPVNGMHDCWNQDWCHKLVLDEPPLLQLSWDDWQDLLKSWMAWFHFKFISSPTLESQLYCRNFGGFYCDLNKYISTFGRQSHIYVSVSITHYRAILMLSSEVHFGSLSLVFPLARCHWHPDPLRLVGRTAGGGRGLLRHTRRSPSFRCYWFLSEA